MTQHPSSLYEVIQQVDGWTYPQENTAVYRKHIEDYYCFMVEGYPYPLGFNPKSKVEQMLWPDYWTVDEKRQALVHSSGSGLEERSAFIANTLRIKSENGKVPDFVC